LRITGRSRDTHRDILKKKGNICGRDRKIQANAREIQGRPEGLKKSRNLTNKSETESVQGKS
jgi:hypothetical protein